MQPFAWTMIGLGVGSYRVQSVFNRPNVDYLGTSQVFQQTAAAAKVRDWRSLPVPDFWRAKPAPAKPQPVPTLYGTRYQSSRSR
jgi:hypothetical protein